MYMYAIFKFIKLYLTQIVKILNLIFINFSHAKKKKEIREKQIFDGINIYLRSFFHFP